MFRIGFNNINRYHRLKSLWGFEMSSDDPTPVFLSNPKIFMDALNEDNQKKRFDLLPTFYDVVICEIVRYGIYNDPQMIPHIQAMYSEAFLKAPVELRKEIYRHVVFMVETIGGGIVGAMTPFMILDTDMSVVSTATLDYASLGSIIINDPMSRVRDTIDLIHKGIAANPGAMIGGLLCLGDPRVCDLLVPLRADLDIETTKTISHCSSGMTARCVVEFYLDWIEEFIDARDDFSEGMIGNVIAGLYRLSDARKAPFIIDGYRPFPVPKGKNVTWPDIKHIEIDDFVKSISHRLYNLERRESSPKLMPHVIRSFGLVPKTAGHEIALMN